MLDMPVLVASIESLDRSSQCANSAYKNCFAWQSHSLLNPSKRERGVREDSVF